MASKRDLLRLLDGASFDSSEFDAKIEELEKQRTAVITKVRKEMVDHINKKSPLWTASLEGMQEYHTLTMSRPKPKEHCGCPDSRLTLHAYRIPEYVKLTKEIEKVQQEAREAHTAHSNKYMAIKRSIMLDGPTAENTNAVTQLIAK